MMLDESTLAYMMANSARNTMEAIHRGKLWDARVPAALRKTPTEGLTHAPTQDAVLALLRGKRAKFWTLRELTDAIGGDQTRKSVHRALAALISKGLARQTKKMGGVSGTAKTYKAVDGDGK